MSAMVFGALPRRGVGGMMVADRVAELALQIWVLLKGNAANRMAITLVRAGAVLAGGPPALVVLVQALQVGPLAKPQGLTVGDYLAIAGFCLGLAMIGLGVFTFYRFRSSISLDDQISFQIPAGWSFKDCVEALVGEGFFQYEGFTAPELKAQLREQQIVVPSVKFGLLGLGTLTANGSFPPYEVENQNGTTYVRKKNV